jgi:hypothetical protein
MENTMKLNNSNAFPKIFVVLILGLVLSPGLPTNYLNAQSKNADDVVAECVKTMGGEDGIKNLYDFEGKGRVKIAYTRGRVFEGELTLTRKGIKSRRETTIKWGSNNFKVVQAYDGNAAWKNQGGTVSAVPELNYKSDNAHSLMLLIQKDVSFSLKGETDLEGIKHTVVEAAAPDGNTTFMISGINGYVSEIRFDGRYFSSNMTSGAVKRKIQFSDYRMIDGKPFPYKITLSKNDKMDLEFIFNSVVLSPKVADNVFQQPMQKLDLRLSDETIH